MRRTILPIRHLVLGAFGLLCTSCVGDGPMGGDAPDPWASFDQSSPPMTVRSMVTSDDGDLLIGGTPFAGAPEMNVLRWNPAEGEWEPLSGTLATRYVSALTHLRGELIAGGLGTTLDTLNTGQVVDGVGLAAWRLGEWHEIGNFVGTVHALTGYRDSLVVVAGHYEETTSGLSNLAVWDGSMLSPMGEAFDGPVHDVLVTGDDLFVAGTFHHVGEERIRSVARWSGSRWVAVDFDLEGRANGITTLEDELVVVGWFKGPEPATRFSVARHAAKGWQRLGDLNLLTGALAAAVFRDALHVAGAEGVYEWTGDGWRVALGGTARTLHEYRGSLIAAGRFPPGRTVARIP